MRDSDLAKVVTEGGRECSRPRQMGDHLSRCWSKDYATCRSCAALHALYTKKLLSSGMEDPDAHYFLLTLTAPSFGKVHSVPHGPSDKLVTCVCGVTHKFGSRLAGVALDLERYRYREAVEWNHSSTKLFHRSWTYLSRELEGVEYAAVREFQTRGLIHLHVVVRVPSLVTIDDAYKKLGKVRSYKFGKFAWGRAADVQLIQTEVAVGAVRYLSKVIGYTTKTLGKSRDLLSDEQREFYGRLDAASVRLGYGMSQVRGFGYGGHVFTKSRGWSDLTKTALRDEARAFAAEAGLSSTDEMRSVIVTANGDELRSLASRLGNAEDYLPAVDGPASVRARLLGVPRRKLSTSVVSSPDLSVGALGDHELDELMLAVDEFGDFEELDFLLEE